jgi:hypothetical protein
MNKILSTYLQEQNTKTGDLLLFNENTGLGSFIKCCTQSKYTHVGILINPLDFTNEQLYKLKITDKNKLYIANSTGFHKFTDIYTNEINKWGVQINELEDFYNNIDETITDYYYRKLNYENQSEYFYELFITLYIDIANATYDANACDWINSKLYQLFIEYNLPLYNICSYKKKNTFFCSAFVAYMLYKLDIINEINWTIISPVMLSSEFNKQQNPIITTANYSFSNEIQIFLIEIEEIIIEK